MNASTSPLPTTSPSSTPTADSSGGGLSGGAIGAIVAVIVILIGGLGAFIVLRRRRQKRMAARAGAMRDPYNEGFSSFPPPPAPPMAFTSPDQYHHNLPAAAITAAGSAPSNPYQPTSPTYPITAPNMISTPTMPPANVAAPVAATAAAANTDYSPQPGDIWQQPPIGTFTVLTTYTPTLSDEIDVQPNDQVQIFEEYDDGWCLGINITRGQKRGVFPKHCVTPDDEPAHNPSSHSLAISDPAGKRISSLYMENPTHQ
ncbi:hypothetical protein BC941DRAFT_442357 [Chlamydoabsidia padenii]|nr:hypothetical protein BC941DRAFT_442357 [Chlamydoabsidia padenii]